MRIAVSMFAGDGGQSGISQYMKQVLGELQSLASNNEYLLYMCQSDRQHFDLEGHNVKAICYPDWVGHPIVNILWHLIWLPLALLLHRADLVFFPAANRRLGFWYPVPSVGTVHDFSQLHVPAKYDKARMFYIERVLPNLMRRLTRIISISESTRRDLLGFAQVSGNKIDLIYNGANLEQFSSLEKSTSRDQVAELLGLAPDEPYLLYVSRIEHPGKNHVRLLDAFKQLIEQDAIAHKLVFVGSRWSGAEQVDQHIEALSLQDRVSMPGFIPAQSLPALYAGADLLVFPSLFEGFGIPVLEAMASGTPVCASNCSSIPEVLGHAGTLFDPHCSQSIAVSIRNMLINPQFYDRCRQSGLERCQQFTWKKAAVAVLASFMQARGKAT